MVDDTVSYEQDQKDFTTILKDGMVTQTIVKGPDGQDQIQFKIDADSAYWKSHNINSYRFGLLAEAVENLFVLGQDARYNMSAVRANVMESQITQLVVRVLKKSIDAKSSETMRDSRNAQTSLMDKYLKRKQETVLDIKGQAKQSLLDGILGKKAEEES